MARPARYIWSGWRPSAGRLLTGDVDRCLLVDLSIGGTPQSFIRSGRTVMSGTMTDLADSAALDTALSSLWQRHRQTNLDRISLLERTAANVLRATIDEKGIDEGSRAAHMLAGSLGTFGFDAGSRAALEAEYLLRENVIDGLRLAEAVAALRASVQGEQAAAIAVLPAAGPNERAGHATICIVSGDINLVSRLTVEAAALGITVSHVTDLPSVHTSDGGSPGVVIDDGPSSTWTRPALFDAVRKLSAGTTVFVLSDHGAFEDRMKLAVAGALGVVDRSRSARHLVSFLSETLERRHPVQSTIRACNLDSQITKTVNALSSSNREVVVHATAAALWLELEEFGADYLIIGFEGSALSGPELCRMVRAHLNWYKLPIVVVGDRDASHFAEAMASGADDYVSSDVSAFELRIRVTKVLTERRIADDRCDLDPVSGTLNRLATDRALDRVFCQSAHDDEPFALAFVQVDRLEQVRSTEGHAVGDEALRRLGARLVAGTPPGSVVGRWADNSFAVGMIGVPGPKAGERVAGITRALTSDRLPTTSGSPVQCTYSAGITSTPIDGSTLASLERMGETALQRAREGEEAVVVSGHRPDDGAAHLVDVVLVEDDDSVADVIEHALGLHQYGFLRFCDGAAAAGALGDGSVKAKIVLLDVGLPSLDGFGVLQILRSNGVLTDTRVIMLTARSSEAEMLRALGLGAMEHITKPFSIPVLLGRLDQSRSLVMS